MTGPKNKADDSDRGSFGMPDLKDYQPKEIFVPDQMDPFAAAVSSLKEIFDSRDPILVSAIQSNLRAFQIAVQREKKIDQQSQEIETLKEKCDQFEEKLTAIERKVAESSGAGPQNGGPTVKDAGNANINMDDSSI